MGACLSASGKTRSVQEDFPFWTYNQITIHLRSPSFDRLILLGVNESTWHEWDTRFDLFFLPGPSSSAAQKASYSDLPALLKSPPNHQLLFAHNREIARFPTCAQGVDRWRKVAELLSSPLAMPAPWEEGVRGSQVGEGVVYRNFFGGKRRRKVEADVGACEMRVWYRFQRNGKVDNFVKAACRELVN